MMHRFICILHDEIVCNISDIRGISELHTLGCTPLSFAEVR